MASDRSFLRPCGARAASDNHGLPISALVFIFFPFLMAAGGVADPGQAIGATILPKQESDFGAEPRGPRAATPFRSEEEAAVFARADLWIANRKLDDAEQILQEQLRRRPDSAGALYRLGRVHFDRHNWARSAGYLLQSLRIEPRNDRAHLILGLDFVELDRLEDAEKELLLAVKQNPQSDEDQYMAGRFFYTQSRIENALTFFYQAVRLNPENFKAYHSLGLCLASLGDYALAETYYKRGIETAEKRNATFTQAYLDLAELLTGIEVARAGEGESVARRAAQMSPDSSEAHFLIGKALYRQGKPGEAVPELKESVRLDPTNSKPHFILARIYQKMGRKAEAAGEWQAFDRFMKLRLDPHRQAGLQRELEMAH